MNLDLSPARAGHAVRAPRDVATLGTLLGVWAHPDDEVYLSGALMCAAAEAGQRVVVITATRGEAGTDDPERWPPDRLARLRAQELAASLAVLDAGHGRIEHRFLGASSHPPRRYVDGTLTGRAGPGGQADAAIDELAQAIIEIHPDTVLTFGPDGMTGHGDHRTVSGWTGTALRRAGLTGTRLLHATLTRDVVEEFAADLAPMDDGNDVPPVSSRSELLVDLELGKDDLDRKVAALRAQASQTRSIEDALGAARYRRFVAAEQFRAAPDGAPS